MSEDDTQELPLDVVRKYLAELGFQDVGDDEVLALRSEISRRLREEKEDVEEVQPDIYAPQQTQK